MNVVQAVSSHADAANRRRRMIVQFDVLGEMTELYGHDIDKLLAFTFHFADERGSQIDSIIWDIGECIPLEGVMANAGIRKWKEQGIDIVAVLLDEAGKRGLENIWNHRISEVDFGPGGLGLGMEEQSRLKAEHPDWVVKSWWWQGLWNLASSDLRAYKLAYLRGIAEQYAIDGIQLDFSRHVPCLPVGRQWECREHATAFVDMVRRMLLEVEAAQGRPLLLAAKVPENPAGCRIDGLDVAEWAERRLVDFFSLGSRTIDVDIAAFRRLTEGTSIKLYPCLDDHHATDGYRHPPIEFFRGVFGNWLQQGADGVQTFNWASATAEVYARNGSLRYQGGPPSQRQAYLEAGSMETLRRKDKQFAVERRGGYPWAEGYFNRNDGAPLPAALANDGRRLELALSVCDDVAACREEAVGVELAVVLYGARPGDRLALCVNGVTCEVESYDYEWKDPQLFSPAPQPASGGSGVYEVNPEQRLLRVTAPVAPGLCKLGANRIGIGAVKRLPFLPGKDIVVEKVELALRYKREAGLLQE
ncbi:alpha-amylase family protein [Paenibacillus cymbidii]|uniref:hypothetical protein n=1 Tax=Paenibacillus cymbidii TaxID=1639034 RepID=UPI001436771B|nr:hypothetical protein [Paenibacillus cymbidii]